MAVFPKVVEGDNILKYVFPTKQKDVQKAIALAKEDLRIRRLIVFGSAITIKCGMISDIDFAIDADITEDEFFEIARKFYSTITSEIHLIHYNQIKSNLLKHEIDTKGREFYVRD